MDVDHHADDRQMTSGASMRAAIALSIGLLASGTAQADLLVGKGAKATLNVQYEYSAVGKNASKDDPSEWRVRRTVNMVVQLSAEEPLALSGLRKMDADQNASLARKQTKIAAVQKKMEPTMNDMMKIAERCGEDEACIEKAIVAYSSTMNTSDVEAVKGDVASVMKQDAPRYQMWVPGAEKGTYSIDEAYRAKTSDPLCSGKPKNQCSREETRKGAGNVPVLPGAKDAYTTRLEIDSEKKEIYIMLPVPLMGLGYAKQVTSDFPDEKSGTSQGDARFPGQLKPMTAAIAGDLRNASGTQTIKLNGAEGEGGTLTVKWQFALQ
jgi:hypothetical protein